MHDFERTFDDAAKDYEISRPVYVKELYDDVFKYTPINIESNVLEIGIGTGKASLPILKTKCNLVGIEPGEHLVSLLKEKFSNYDNLEVYNKTLQEYKCSAQSFDFIYSATAFHWIPEEYGYKRVYELLKEGGVFARFAYHASSDKKRKTLTLEMKNIYQKYMNTKEYGEEDAKKLSQIAKKYGFVDTQYKIYHLTKDFTSQEYIKLLKTYPDHMTIEKSKREKLFEGIYDAINKHGGVITVYYTIDLQLGRKE